MTRRTSAPIGYRTLLHEPLEEQAERHPKKLAVRGERSSWSYEELRRASLELAAALQERGVERGDRVAVYTDNGPETAAGIFGTLMAGGAFVMVNPLTKADKLTFILNDCDVKVLVADAALSPIIAEACADAPALAHVLLVEDGKSAADVQITGPEITAFSEALGNSLTEAFRRPPLIPPDLAALIYTSGSTGNPKGVIHTHQSMVFALGSVSEYLGLQEDDVIVNVLPLAFDYGLYQLLMGTAVGATLVVERSFAYPGRVLKRMSEEGVTVFPGVPTVFSMLLAAHERNALSFPRVRAVTNTAAALPPEFIGRLSEIFPNARVFPMYGLTECKRVSYLEPELAQERRGSVGKGIPGTEVFLRTPEGEPVPPRETGILHVRGPHVMRGYWNNPVETEKMLVPGEIPGEVWLRTGDWFRTDEDGFLYFVGRSDDIIKTRAEKVSPAEVENALYSIDGVEAAAVIGVPDETLGEAIRAYVVLRDGMERNERRLRRELTGKLESFMLPKEIVFRDELPKSPNGKILRRVLQEEVS